jgi:glycosyltransferase involved in cell wall biosynthesis
MPAFNVADFLPGAIRSVLAQSHVDWSMVVVDDGSTDATASVAAGFCDERICVIRQQNAGVSAARNAGITAVNALPGHPPFVAAEGDPAPDAFLFLDADDWLAPDALATLAEALDEAPGAVASIGRFARVGLDNVVRVAASPPEGDLLECLLTRNLFANGGHLLIRSGAIAAAGAFRPELSYGEDWEYWVRLAMCGEFVSVRAAAPLLFVRERLAGAYLSRATDPAEYRPAIEAIGGNAGLRHRLGATRVLQLARRAEAEMAWTVGRELVRHGRCRDGLRWLARSLQGAPVPKRLALLGLACLRVGPFRPYHSAGVIAQQ